MITMQDCLDMYEKGFATVIDNGDVVAFVKETEDETRENIRE